MNITLRPAVAEDHQFVQSVYYKAQRALKAELSGLYMYPKFDDFYDEQFTRIILVDGHEAGFLSVLRRRDYSNIQCLFLRPEYQNRGIGTHLLQDVIAQAQQNGTRLTIGTHPGNRAQHLYKRLGFAVIWERAHRIEFEYPDPFTEG